MLGPPTCRWAARSFQHESSGSFALFFSKTLYTSQPRGVCSRDPLSYSKNVQSFGKRRKFSQNTATRLEKRQVTRELTGAKNVNIRDQTSNALKERRQPARPFDGYEEEENVYTRELNSPSRISRKIRGEENLSILTELELILLGTRSNLRKQALEEDLLKTSNLEVYKLHPPIRPSEETPEARFLARLSLSKATLDEYVSLDRTPTAPAEIVIHPQLYCDIVSVAEGECIRGATISTSLTLSALEASAGIQSPTFMLYFMKQLTPTKAGEYAGTILLVNRFVQSAAFNPQDTQMRAELLTILTGHPLGFPQNNGNPHEPSLLSLVTDHGELASETGYLECVRHLGGAEAISHIWNAYVKPKQNASPSEALEARKVMEPFIRELLLSQPAAPALAWDLAKPLLEDEGSLQESTVEMLMDWPEFIDENVKLPPYMLKHLMKGMEVWAQRVEQGLGVTWDAHAKTHTAANHEMAELMLGRIYSTSDLFTGDQHLEKDTAKE